MTFLAVVTRGLLRRPVRTGLTIAGISVGIGAVVALVGMARGFETSWTTGLKSRRTDVDVSNMASSLTPKPFNASAVQRIQELPHVAETCALLVDFTSIEKADMMIVSARQWDGFAWKNLNTMLMTVFERTEEICVLLAIGWKRRRIVRMILYESALLGFLGGAGGVIIGILGVKLLVTAPVIRGLLEPDLNAALVAQGLAIAILAGVLSGLYPAWRSSRLLPGQALHE